MSRYQDIKNAYLDLLSNPVDGVMPNGFPLDRRSSVFVRPIFEIDEYPEEWNSDDTDEVYTWSKAHPIVRFDGRPLPPMP